MNWVIFGFIWGGAFKLVFQIDWLDNGRKEMCSSVRCSDFPYGNSFIGNCNPCVREVLCVVR